LIQAGIVEIVYPETNGIPERWQDDFNTSNGMLHEAGIQVRTV
jgi:deoxycytidylate deaminase